MVGYASRTGTVRNLDALRQAGWRLMVSATGAWRTEGFRYAIDNGAWTAFQSGKEFDERAFNGVVEALGQAADFVIVPDIVCGGLGSLRLSESWLPRLAHLPGRLLVAVQNGIEPADVRPILGGRVGIFVGGDTTGWGNGRVPACGPRQYATPNSAVCDGRRAFLRRHERDGLLGDVADARPRSSIGHFLWSTSSMNRDVVVLLSGGVDSSVLASRALADGRLAFPVFIDYGQPSAPEERTAAEAWCSANGQSLRVVRVGGLVHSPLAAGAGNAGPRVVQGRNLAFAALAAMVVQPGSRIWIGANADDRADYPDCRPSFFNLLSLAMRMGGAEVKVEAPFALVSRESIVAMAAELGVNLTSTWSCYEPIRGQPCGSCDACRRGPQRGCR